MAGDGGRGRSARAAGDDPFGLAGRDAGGLSGLRQPCRVYDRMEKRGPDDVNWRKFLQRRRLTLASHHETGIFK